MGDHIGRITRHEQALQAGTKRQDVFCQVAAVHLGHHHVGHEKVDIAGMFSRQADGLARSAGRQHSIPAPIEHQVILRIAGSSSTSRIIS